jgi:pimeloyl-ACP methyl ester carboxylesterase/predicted glycosyltransferase
MRASNPNQEGDIIRDGVRIHYAVYGSGAPTILLLPTWSIIHSQFWKAQIPYLARHGRVITFDGRGNGRSDRPTDPAAYDNAEFVADCLAIMDVTQTQRAAIVGLSMAAQWSLMLAAEHPERIERMVLIGPTVPLPPYFAQRMATSFDSPQETYAGWGKYNEHYWRQDYRGFAEFFFTKCFPEPHSTKQIEDCVGWALDSTPEMLITKEHAPGRMNVQNDEGTRWVEELAAQVHCPVLVIHGDCDKISPVERGKKLAELLGGTLVVMEGSGHIPLARDPVRVNHLLRDFIFPSFPATLTWMRGRNRQKRVLFLSSPIGLGHAQRDVAIAQELRKLHPDLHIDWLAQHPVTNVLAAHGETIHPASQLLSNESAHIESESAEHDLHCFQALRRMDEILVANFMVFQDLVETTPYDLWIGDEAWELDYFLHENPELKRAAFAWLTDFVGYLPMSDGGAHEHFLTADYNAEMIEHIARYPRLRDQAIFVGNPDDIVSDSFGVDLPEIRAWTKEHFSFSGYITGFDPALYADRAALRAELGYHPDEQICIVTVGGSGVGLPLLRRVVAAYTEARRQVAGLRMIVVTGPRIDPASLTPPPGVEVRAYVPDLYRHLAACDIAVVQGGLTTCMELTANRRPFLYFPLQHHFEQNFHVRHRLNRYAAGRCMDYATATAESIAAALAEEINRPLHYRAVESDGAARAAASLAKLL